jgi:phosphopentomutase
VLGDRHASGTEIIEELGAEHVRTGAPICYTSADSVFQIAAHEQTFGLERLYEVCEIARRLCRSAQYRARVIARPFLGDAETGFRRTANRRDYAIPPPEPTLCDRVTAAGGAVIGIGKIGDIFAHRGVGEVRKGAGDAALIEIAVESFANAPDGALVFANFVEFDSSTAIAATSRATPRRWSASTPRCRASRRAARGDLLILTADHGNDPTWAGTDHTREMVPILATGRMFRRSRSVDAASPMSARPPRPGWGCPAARMGRVFCDGCAALRLPARRPPLRRDDRRLWPRRLPVLEGFRHARGLRACCAGAWRR